MNKSEFDINILRNAIATLQESWQVYTREQSDALMAGIVADSCVTRFEYTLETSLKLMRRYLKLEYAKDDKELTVNNIFRLMQGYTMIPDWENWKNYYAQRNNTSHEYNIEKARDLLPVLPTFINDVNFLIASFDRVLI
ncbi:MAG: nucleotidyltransferase substrate binding protein [Alphaproteobacteria bacterium]|nr:nucleotidyltransferase substrate binding protein [Alphaproteobacteria bacterium]